ncbi:MAG: hypothetical protein WBG42_10925, partial [Cryomorphaceae bacterium]
MKKSLNSLLLAISCLLISFFQCSFLNAQENCELSKVHGEGYTSTIASVVNNGDDSYTITLHIENDGCEGCKAINRYSVQATPGTYSDVVVEGLTGDFSFSTLDLGP